MGIYQEDLLALSTRLPHTVLYIRRGHRIHNKRTKLSADDRLLFASTSSSILRVFKWISKQCYNQFSQLHVSFPHHVSVILCSNALQPRRKLYFQIASNNTLTSKRKRLGFCGGVWCLPRIAVCNTTLVCCAETEKHIHDR